MTRKASEPPKRRADLQQRLCYQFKNPALLEEALTHASAVSSRHRANRCNEQLEFLGDRVVGLVVATVLHERYGRESVGALARRHSALVRSETLADIARQLGLPAEMVMSSAEIDAGGREKQGLLADVCEAVIAAVFLDGGYAAASQLVRSIWEPLVDENPASSKDAKTALQEWTQSQSLDLPAYTLLETKGVDHAPVFLVQVSVTGFDPATGEGTSKRRAEQVAAACLLTRLRGWNGNDGSR